MSEALATRGEEMRRGPMTADDLARQVADLKRQVEQIKPGVEDRISIIVFSGDWTKSWLPLSLQRARWPWGWKR
jgi:hypothetical protein